MTTALQEIVERYEQYVTAWHNDVQTLAESPHFSDAENCPGCFFSRSLISRARAELERGVDVRRLLHDSGFCDEFGATSATNIEAMKYALRQQGVRVVEDGKESSDGK